VSDWRRDPVADPKRPWASDPVIGQEAQKASASPLIVLGPDLPVPDLFRAPPNPNSAGLYPIGRRFTVGDEATLTLSPLGSLFASAQPYTVRVTAVDEARERVEVNGGEVVWDLAGNHVKVGGVTFDPPRQVFPSELFVGKRWRAAYRRTQLVADGRLEAGSVGYVEVELDIVGRERLAIAAGEFVAFRVEGRGRSGRLSLEETIWLVPYLNFPLRWDRSAYWESFLRRDYLYAERRELVSARQFAIDRPA
jgi:hypothetical protein